MATSTSKTQCFTCGKFISTYTCRECLQNFCFIHLTEHRQRLGKLFNQIEKDRDELQQILIEQKQNPKTHLLIQEINQWENDSIQKIQEINQGETDSVEKIKQTANECKQILIKLSIKNTNEIENKLIILTEQLKENRQKSEFNEIELNQFKLILEKLAKELDQPPNVFVRQDSISFINKISVRQGSNEYINIFSVYLSSDTKWKQNGSTIAGGNGQGDGLNHLSLPVGIYVDDDQTIYIADCWNHRIVEWKCNEKNGQIVAGGNGRGNRNNQLNLPTDVIIDKQNHSFIICDQDNRRVMRWSRQNNTSEEIIISDIDCNGLTMDNNGYLYVSGWQKNDVRRWRIGDSCGIIVAGGNGQGDHLNQLNSPSYIFVDEDYSVYVSDWENHRVMKWMKGAKEGIIVAGGNGQGNSLTQLSYPRGVIVDQLGQIYVADRYNDRVMRWCKGAKEGTIVVGGNGRGKQLNQFYGPTGLSFDGQGNLYVVDCWNHRIQKFEIE